MTVRAHRERGRAEQDAPAPELAHGTRTPSAAVLQLQRAAGNHAVTALLGSARLARAVVRNGRPLSENGAAAQLTNAAAQVGLDLKFGDHPEGVKALLKAEKTYDLAKDTNVEKLIEMWNSVSGQTLTAETAPKAKPKERKEPAAQVPQPKKEKEPPKPKSEAEQKEEAEAIIREEAQPDGNGGFVYRRGGTGTLESALRLRGDVVHKTSEPDGRRVLTVGSVRYVEKDSPFPASAEVTLAEEHDTAVTDVCGRFALTSPKAIAFVTDLFRIALAKKAQTAGIKRQIQAFLVALDKDRVTENITYTLDELLASTSVAETYEDIVTSSPGDASTAFMSIAGVETVPAADPELVTLAEALIRGGILSSPAWLAARTDAEFAGVAGEFLTHQQIGAVMPPGVAANKGDEVLQLHSVHFIGDRYAKGKDTPTRTNTDVCAELDLMTAVKQAAGGYVCQAVGNTKVSKSSLAPEAASQNRDALAALKSAANKGERVELPSDKAVEIVVRSVTGTVVITNAQEALTPLALAETVDQRTIGAHGASGDYTHRIAQNFQRVHAIALILRGRMKTGKGI